MALTHLRSNDIWTWQFTEIISRFFAKLQLRLIMRVVVESVDVDHFTDLIGAVSDFFSYTVHVKFTGCILWASYYLSTNMPACTAWTILLNLGFSSARRLTTPIFLLNVHASQSRTSLGTLSPCKSLSSSSASNRCLDDRQKEQWGWEADAFIYLVVLVYFSIKFLTFPNLFDFLRSWVLSDIRKHIKIILNLSKQHCVWIYLVSSV